MTWSAFTKKNGGNPLTRLPNIDVRNRPSIVNRLLNIDDRVYDIYEDVFLGKAEIMGDVDIINRAINFTEQWLNNDNLGSKIDLHGITREGALFWLEYQKRNRQNYKYPITLITGRGSHSHLQVKKDLAEVLLTGNNSTGILEDMVLTWLKQNHQRHIKYTGNFVIY